MKKIPLPGRFLPVLLLCAGAVIARAQTRTLSGTVTTEGQPLAGVSVSQEGRSTTAVTNSQGYWQLTTEGDHPVLLFRHPDYAEERTEAGTQTTLNTQLTRRIRVSEIEEVVVNAGYYKVKDRERTGSIARVTAKDIENQPVTNVLSAVQGRMAGVSITENSGTAGGGFDIQIRGKNSLRPDGNSPLIIIDGVPANTVSNSFSVISSGVLSKGDVSPLNSLNPSDIESFEVLKDADATAIYGSRGANGVILITTKHGSANRTNLQLSLSTNISKANRFLKLANTQEYLQMRKDAYKLDGIANYPNTAYDVNGTWNQERETDWYRRFIGKEFTGTQQHLAWSGGVNNIRWYLSLNHLEQESSFGHGFGYRRKGFDFSSTISTPDKRLKISPTFQYSIQSNKLADTDLTRQIFLAPNAPEIYTPDGALNWQNNTFDNPYAKLVNTYNTDINMLSMGMQTEYDLGRNFALKLNAGYTSTIQSEIKLNPSSAYNPSQGISSAVSSNYTGNAVRKSWIAEPQLHWNGAWNRHQITALLGGTWENRQDDLFRVLASDFSSNALIENVSSAKIQKVLEDTDREYRYMAFFARMNYSYAGRYIWNLTARRDGSSRFGPNKRFATFGAVGAAWLFSKEPFLENVSWLSFGKLRMSAGTAGSDLIGDYQFLDTYTSSSSNYAGIIGLYPSRLYNPNFSWEKTTKLEGAIEAGFFQNKVNLTIAHYKHRSSNQLTGIPLPATTGFLTVQSNFPATIENTGTEVEFQITPIRNPDINWTFYGNFTKPESKLLEFDNIESSAYAYTYEVGASMNVKKVYELKGVNPETGIYEFTDFNQDGKIDIQDRRKVVDFGIQYQAGFGSDFRFKNFNTGFFLQFVKQRQYLPDYNLPVLGGMRNVPSYMLDYWTPDNKDAVYMRPTTGTNSAAMRAYSQYQSSDRVIADASYLRLSHLHIGYKISFTTKLIQELQLHLQAKNLLTITRYPGLDPEVQGLYMPTVTTYSLTATFKF